MPAQEYEADDMRYALDDANFRLSEASERIDMLNEHIVYIQSELDYALLDLEEAERVRAQYADQNVEYHHALEDISEESNAVRMDAAYQMEAAYDYDVDRPLLAAPDL